MTVPEDFTPEVPEDPTLVHLATIHMNLSNSFAQLLEVILTLSKDVEKLKESNERE